MYAKTISIFLIIPFLLTSCRNNEDPPQLIDQVLNIYVKNTAGQDLLNTRLKDSYSGVALLDLLADTDQKPVSSALLKDKDTISYVEYVAGATRLIKDSVNQNTKTYYSLMIMRFTKIINQEQTTDNDTIRIEYSWTPQKFEVAKMWHSNHLVFTKSSASPPNIANIVK